MDQVSWLASQPDSQLSSQRLRQERHALEYLHIGTEYSTALHFIRNISGDVLTRNLHLLQPFMHAELRLRIDGTFGASASDEWTEIKVYDAFQNIVFQTMTHCILGPELSRDEHFVGVFRRYVMATGMGIVFVGELPRLLKGLIARILRLPLLYYHKKTLAILTPVVARHLEHLDEEKSPSNRNFNFIWHCAKISEKNAVGGIGTRASPATIAEWIMFLVFSGATSMAIVATNVLVNMSNHPLDDQVIPLLRKEAEELFLSHKHREDSNGCEDDSVWHQNEPFKRMPLTDSFIRESLRFQPVLIKGLIKEVVPGSGVLLPGTSIRMPAGSWVGVPTLGIHRDARFYPNPEAFMPFRFANSAGELEAGKPTTTYLSFGYGKQAW